MNRSEQINELATALAKAQSVIKGAMKDSDNPFFKSTYADLTSVWEACRKPLTDNGLSVTQLLGESDSGVVIETVLLHSSGQWISSSYSMPVVKQTPQDYGSAITYARRYALAAIVGVAPEDDDGNRASGREIAAKQADPAKPKTKAAYSEEKFNENFENWRKLILSGSTASDIINKIKTMYTLTPEQINAIQVLEKTHDHA